MSGFAIFVSALVVLSIVVVFMGVKVVPQGKEYTVERWGRYVKTLKPGFNFITPVIERVGVRMNMREMVMDIPSQEVITKDNAMVGVDAVCYFQVQSPEEAAYNVNDLERGIQNLVLTNIRNVVGNMDLDSILSQRDEMNAKLLMVVDEAASSWGTKIRRIEIKDVEPPRDLVDAMARQMKAERLKRAEILEAEGRKQSRILDAEGERQQQILVAEGEKEAAFREAEARERQGEAEAKATTLVSKAISEGDINAINYFVATKYVEALQAMGASENSKTVFMPMEASGVIGSVGGIAELVKGMK